MKIAYIGIDLFYPALENLCRLGCEIAKIFTCETDNVTEFNEKIIAFAEKRHIPYSLKRITREDITELSRIGCDFAVCAGYYYRIPPSSALPIVNIHPSLLPMGRGSWPMPLAILNRLSESGVTIHKIAEGFDTGDILLQRRFCLSERETLVGFMEKVYDLLPEMLFELTENFDVLYKNAKPQGEGEYLEAPSENDYTVMSDMTYDDADLILRAFLGYECIYRSRNAKYKMIGGFATDRKTDFPVRGGFVSAERIEKIE